MLGRWLCESRVGDCGAVGHQCPPLPNLPSLLGLSTPGCSLCLLFPAASYTSSLEMPSQIAPIMKMPQVRCLNQGLLEPVDHLGIWRKLLLALCPPYLSWLLRPCGLWSQPSPQNLKETHLPRDCHQVWGPPGLPTQ